MARARRKKRGSPSKPWRTIPKKANTGAKARTNVRDRAAAPRTGASLRQQKHENLYGSAQETEIYVRQGRWPGVTSQSGVLIHTSIAGKVRSYRGIKSILFRSKTSTLRLHTG